MPSRSEGWGGLFKDEQYRLIRSASRTSIRWLRDFEQTTPALRACPSLLRRGMGRNHTYYRQHRAKRSPDVDLRLRFDFILDSSASPRRGGRDLNKILRSLLYGADGVMAKFQQNLIGGYSPPRLRELRMLCGILLIAQPPSSERRRKFATPPFGQHQAIARFSSQST
jgi:hypothetical protein